jgi:hypothetical protein
VSRALNPLGTNWGHPDRWRGSSVPKILKEAYATEELVVNWILLPLAPDLDVHSFDFGPYKIEVWHGRPRELRPKHKP